MNLERRPGMLGRLPQHDPATHPRVCLSNHIAPVKLPKVIDYCSKVPSWPMYLNDRLGDCTCAAVGHQVQAWTAYASTEFDLSDNDVLSLYESLGYVPGEPATDRGAVIQDVLTKVASIGIAGHKEVAFTEVDHTNMQQVLHALYLFGSVYLGIDCPQSAQQQFANQEKWTYVRNSPIEGGHAIVLQAKKEDGTLDIITWGAVQEMDKSFWKHYVKEAWAVVSPDWFDKTGKTPEGLDMDGLMKEFRSIQR